MALDQDIAQLALQEERLQFPAFDADTAWALGNTLRAAAVARGYRIAIEVRQFGFPLFYSALPGTSPDNADWLRRKRNVVERFHKSSYAVGLSMEKRGMTLVERYGIPLADFVGAGGGFPIRVKGTGVVGFVGVSGLAARDDHGFIVEIIAGMLGESISELALAAE
ncbi:heme-degrading domain-containing protein [Uliginosibacterium sp. 31-16]|uniref:heme-degrading domain-containing protein n=1 Tax=Uliginosibacterium sp. 31-16 TaxID=3068315 RepID=UPI00273E242E|nr:heme-degrading domain-containing protein [Uliginosibacterium sp. 31-16]MDP5240698.1 heme-degrading domain-containing protein [Uliginosibacterium sp. 31-16]